MLKILASFLLSFCITGIITCKSNLAQNTEKVNKLSTSISKRNSDTDCAEWTRTYMLLSETGKENVQKYYIAVNGDDKSVITGYYVLSSKLVNNCTLRIKIGILIYRVVTGTDTETDRRFAEENSDQIVKVLRQIWNAPAFSSDGTSHEKYLLLVNTAIKDNYIAPFIGELLKSEGLNSELIYVLVTRPQTSLIPILYELLKESENQQDLPKQIYALIILMNTSPQPQFLSKLKTISRNKTLSSNTKKGIVKIINKFQVRNKVTYKDIEDLELPLED